MTCTQVASGVVVCRPSDQFLRKEILYCPMCQCRTEMAVRYEGWYGTSVYCCRCGDSWCDGELYPRPFARGWRDRAVKKHRAMWDRATHGPPPSFEDLYPDFEQHRQIDHHLNGEN